MLYYKTNFRGVLKGYNNFIYIQDDCKLLFISKENFTIVKELDLPDFSYAMQFYSDKIVLTNLKDRHIQILPNELSLIEFNEPCYPINQSIFYCPKEKKYIINGAPKAQSGYERNFNFEFMFFDHILIECSLHQPDASFVRAYNLLSAKEEWRTNINGKISRIENSGNYLIINYHDQIGKTIVLNINGGKECWNKEEVSRVDLHMGVVFFSQGNQVTIKVIENGETLNSINVTPEYYLGYHPHFIDSVGIYYTTHEGSFGKIHKANGAILWEFDLIDDKGAKRRLSDWILLGNGNLVLQAMPNHPNGDLTCIFNPEENLEFSNVINGVRKVNE